MVSGDIYDSDFTQQYSDEWINELIRYFLYFVVCNSDIYVSCAQVITQDAPSNFNI